MSNEPENFRTDVHNNAHVEALVGESARKRQPKGITAVLCCSVFGTICGTSLMIGFNSGVVNNAAPVLKQYFSGVKLNRTGTNFTLWQLTWFWSACVAAFPLSAPVGCYIGSRSANKFGRKKTLMGNAILLITSGLLQSLSKPAESYEMFFIGRVVIGLQVGIGSTVGSMYISEISPTDYRGAFGAIFDFFYTLGVVASAVLGFESIFGNDEYWPFLFAVLIICALVHLTTSIFSPESPRFLLINRKDRAAAFNSLRTLRGIEYNNEEELQQITNEARETECLREVSYSDYLKCPELRKPLILAVIAVCSIPFSGLTAINMYSEPILAAVLSTYGIGKSNYSRYIVALLHFSRLIISLPAIFFIDKIGRRKCAMCSMAGLLICNVSLSILLSDISTDGQLCDGISVGNTGNGLTLFFFFAHSASFACGVSSIAWIITPELFRTNTRPKASSIAVSVFWVSYFTNAFAFEAVEKVLCGWSFLVFATIMLLSIIYFWFNLPVLDRKSVNEIVSYFESENQTEVSKNKVSSETTAIEENDEKSPLLR